MQPTLRIEPNRWPETILMGDLLKKQFPPRENLIGPWLRQGESALLWAVPGAGKTLLAMTMAAMVAGGGSALGWTSPRPRKVLLIDGEMNQEDLKDRAEWLINTVEGIDKEAVGRNLRVVPRTMQKAGSVFPDLSKRDRVEDKASDQDIYMEMVRQHEAELVIFDNYSTLAEVEDENAAASLSPVVAFLLKLKQERIGCILVHHANKNGLGFRGSSKLATTFEVILGLKPLETTVSEGGAAFTLEWTKYRREVCEAVQSREVRLIKDIDGRPMWFSGTTEDREVRRLLALVKSGDYSSQAALGDAMGCSQSKISKLQKKAVAEKLITRQAWRDYLSGEPDDF